MAEYIDNDETNEDIPLDLSELVEPYPPQPAKKGSRTQQVENRWKIEEILAQKRLKAKDRDPFEDDMD